MMSEESQRGYNTGAGEPEDMLAVVERIRSVPRLKPRLAFRMRMSLYSRLPSVGYRLVNRHEASIIERRILGSDYGRNPGWVVSAWRVAVAVTVIFLLAVGTFGVLTVAARNSNPGDPLYSIKRFSEDVELAFTWGKAGKVEKSLLLAEKRLSELDYLISRKELDSSRVVEVAQDYSDKTRTVEEILLSDGGLENARSVAAQLKEVKSAEKKIERRLAAAGAVATLAPGEGARVTVRDTSGRGSFQGRDYYSSRAAADGKLSFPADLAGPRSAADLEVSVELDGRIEIMPAYRIPAESTGPLAASVEPEVETLELNSPESFTLTITSTGGTRVSGLSVRLRDASNTSYVNGTTGEAALVTDSRGRCSFTVEKRSIERVSRISARVLDGSDQDLGEILVLGGLEAPDSGKTGVGDVIARASGPAGGPQAVELDNGLVRISVSASSKAGTVIESVSRSGVPGESGSLCEPMSDSSGAALSTSGPYLAYSGPGAAGYEVSFELNDGGASVKKVYRVSLARGDTFATIDCTVAVDGVPPAGDGWSRVDDVALLETGDNVVDVSVERVTPTAGEERLVRFEAGEPFAVIGSGSTQVVFACPINSDAQPIAWSFGHDGVALRLHESASRSGSETTLTAILGVTDRAGIDQIEGVALKGVPDRSATTPDETADEGFLLTVSPSAQEIRDGKQYMTLTVFKRYQRIFED